MDTERLSKQLAGRVVARVAQRSDASIAIHFEDRSVIVVEQHGDGVTAGLRERGSGSKALAGAAPTRRQREYLEFIKKYTFRYGFPPAESDIQRHFMVSAPSANQMVRTLERRGFITRAKDVTGQALPRSIRVLIDDP